MRYQVIIFDSNHCELCEKDILNYYGERDVEELASSIIFCHNAYYGFGPTQRITIGDKEL